MYLNGIIYNYSSYATTNPPTSSVKEYNLSRKIDGSIVLDTSVGSNGAICRKTFSVPKEIFDEITLLFESENLMQAIADKLNSEPKPVPPAMVGGMVSESLSFMADGMIITLLSIPPQAREIINRLSGAADRCGEPIFEDDTGKDKIAEMLSNINMAQTILNQSKEKKSAPSEPKPAEGEWFCTNCGHKNSSAKFCVECGTQKSV